MAFPNILYPISGEYTMNENVEIPDFFVDLNLDQVVNSITNLKQEYKLEPYFYMPLHDIETINARQDIFRDLENESVLKAIKIFAEKMVLVRRYLNMIEKLYVKYQKEGWFLEAAMIYCEAVEGIVRDLQETPIKSKGLVDFLAYVIEYTTSPRFLSLQSDSIECNINLSTIKYSVITKGNWVRVQKYKAEINYSKEVERTFEKFKQGKVKNYRIDLVSSSGMNHIKAQILDCVAKLFPSVFKELDAYYLKHLDFMDNIILTFDRQIQFFVSYYEFIVNLKRIGSEFCYPVVTKDKAVYAQETFDIALANKLLFESTPLVRNDFYLEGNERIFVVSGPNQGGKTTFARMFGQLHYLASLGCPVPGRNVALFLNDQIFTHFEKEEDIRNLRGKLQDDLVRIHNILERATSDSIIIVNELFTSTTLKDALFLNKEIIQRIIFLGALGIFVTFIDELSTLGEQTVSMVSTVVPEIPTQRTFKVIRLPADGLSYAICIAEKYHLTYHMIKERIFQ